MFGKNDTNNKIRAGSEKQYRFSIRKLTIGAASVMLSAFMWNAVSTTQAHAAEQPQATVSEEIGGGATIL
ncbi:MAG: YSIRK-type signal peptide-containing protein [Lactobacillus sp.]|nr:YSIRK-type signal peptide-containing protein [Lactobacillus sp.]